MSFEEATTVFYDEDALIRDDPDHSEDEERFIILGFSATTKILVVSHCYRESEEVIRIISARKATKVEGDLCPTVSDSLMFELQNRPSGFGPIQAY